MSASDFNTVLVKDSRLASITDSLTYAVHSGASSNTYQVFQAVSSSNSQLAFNIQVPSENVVVNREVLLRAKLQFTMEYDPNANDAFAVNLCGGDALAPFPLNQLFTTATAQINNTNVSSNIQDILPVILQMTSQKELSCYNDMTPNMLDTFYAKFSDTLTSFSTVSSTNSNVTIPNNNSPLAGYNNQSLDSPFRPRGSFNLRVASIRAVSATAGSTAGTQAKTNASGGTPVGDTQTFHIAFEADVVEPIIGLSPFTYGDNQYNKQGLVGVNSMNFVFNIDSTLSRLMCCADGKTKSLTAGWTSATGATVSNALFKTAEILINFMSTQPTDLIPARNVVPYMDLPRYITQKAGSLTAATATDAMTGIIPTTTKISSNSIQLNQLPDYFIITVRPSLSGTGVYANASGKAQAYAPHFVPITTISVNLNNTSGLLSSATQADLYRISTRNHSQQTWEAFSGHAKISSGDRGSAVLNKAKTLGFQEIATTGSVLVLNPAYDLSLPDYLSSGSLGAFNFQFTVDVESYLDYACDLELVVICANSGIFTTIAGSSNIYTGILTKSMVLDAKKEGAEDPIQSVQYERMVGGMMPNNSGVESMPLVKEALKKAFSKRDSMGSGVSASGVYSGGGVSAGRSGKFSHLIS
jgi:hypothetical protein